MSSPASVECSNPDCGKLNPVFGDAFPGREYTCVFCGHLFKAQPKSSAETADKSKKTRGKKAPRQKESKPKNRNLNKPLL